MLPTMYAFEGSRGQRTKTKAFLLHTAKIYVQDIYCTLEFLDPDEGEHVYGVKGMVLRQYWNAKNHPIID